MYTCAVFNKSPQAYNTSQFATHTILYLKVIKWKNGASGNVGSGHMKIIIKPIKNRIK